MAFVKNQIVKRLERFIKNLSSDTLTISLLKGEAKLSDVQLNENALMDILKLPPFIVINSAICNELYIKIPWTKLNTDSIFLFIDFIEINIFINQNINLSKNFIDSVLESTKTSMQNINVDFSHGHYFSKNNQVQSYFTLIDKIIDGVKLSINSITININYPLNFMASLEISSVLIESTNFLWKPCTLKQSRISLKEFGTYLHFKSIKWNNTRLEIQILPDINKNFGDNKMQSTIKIITSQNKLELVIQKFFPNINTYPSFSSNAHNQMSPKPISIIKSHLSIDSILWIINESQIPDLMYAASAFARISHNMKKSMDNIVPNNQNLGLDHNLLYYNPNVRLIPILQSLIQSSSSKNRKLPSSIHHNTTSAKDKYASFLQFLVYEESSHIEIERLDLHLVQRQRQLLLPSYDKITKNNSNYLKESVVSEHNLKAKHEPTNKSLQITFEKLLADIYPKHPYRLNRSFLPHSPGSYACKDASNHCNTLLSKPQNNQLNAFWERFEKFAIQNFNDFSLGHDSDFSQIFSTVDSMLKFSHDNLYQKLTRFSIYGDINIRELSLFDTPPFNGLILFHQPKKETIKTPQPFLIAEFSEYFYAPFSGSSSIPNSSIVHPSQHNLDTTAKSFGHSKKVNKDSNLPSPSQHFVDMKLLFNNFPLPHNSMNCHISGLRFVASYDTLAWLTMLASAATTSWNDFYLIHLPFNERHHTDTHLSFNDILVILPTDYGNVVALNGRSKGKDELNMNKEKGVETICISLHDISIINYIWHDDDDDDDDHFPPTTLHGSSKRASHKLTSYLTRLNDSIDYYHVRDDKFPNQTADQYTPNYRKQLPQIDCNGFKKLFYSPAALSGPLVKQHKYYGCEEGNGNKINKNRHLWYISYLDKWLVETGKLSIYYQDSANTFQYFRDINSWYASCCVNSSHRQSLFNMPKPIEQPLLLLHLYNNNNNNIKQDLKNCNLLLEPISFRIWLIPCNVKLKHNLTLLQLIPNEKSHCTEIDYSKIPGLEHVKSSKLECEDNEITYFDYQVLINIFDPVDCHLHNNCHIKDSITLNLYRPSYLCMLKVIRCFNEMSENFVSQGLTINNFDPNKPTNNSITIKSKLESNNLPSHQSHHDNYAILKESIRVKMALSHPKIAFNLFENLSPKEQPDSIKIKTTLKDNTEIDKSQPITPLIIPRENTDLFNVVVHEDNEEQISLSNNDKEEVESLTFTNLLSDEEDEEEEEDIFGHRSLEHLNIQSPPITHSSSHKVVYKLSPNNNLQNPFQEDTISIKSERINQQTLSTRSAKAPIPFLRPLTAVGNITNVGDRNEASQVDIDAPSTLKNEPSLETGIDLVSMNSLDEEELRFKGSTHQIPVSLDPTLTPNPLHKDKGDGDCLLNSIGQSKSDKPSIFCHFQICSCQIDVDIWKCSDLSQSIYSESYKFDFKLWSDQGFIRDSITHRLNETRFSKDCSQDINFQQRSPESTENLDELCDLTFLKMFASYSNLNTDSLTFQILLHPTNLFPLTLAKDKREMIRSFPKLKDFNLQSNYLPISSDTLSKVTELLADDPDFIESNWQAHLLQNTFNSHPNETVHLKCFDKIVNGSPYSLYLLTDETCRLNLISQLPTILPKSHLQKSSISLTEFPIQICPLILYKTPDSDVFTMTNLSEFLRDMHDSSNIRETIFRILNINPSSSMESILAENVALKKEIQQLQSKHNTAANSFV